jgi:hypothetical protein
MRVFSDTTTIRLHVVVGGFVENYMIWTYHGEKAPPPMENTLDEMIEDVEFDRLFDAYDEFFADVGDDDGDGVSEGPIDGGSDDGSDNKLDAGDFLSQLLRHTKAELLVVTAKGVSKLRGGEKISGAKYIRAIKGCPKYWTVLHFILELLTVKAKHSWSDSSFNDLLRMLAWLLPKPSKVSANTYRAKKLVSPFTMGVERIHACLNYCILYHGDTFKDLDKYPICSACRQKNNADYCGGDIQGPSDGNKRKRKGARNSAASVELVVTTLGISEKQSRIPAWLCGTSQLLTT